MAKKKGEKEEKGKKGEETGNYLIFNNLLKNGKNYILLIHF